MEKEALSYQLLNVFEIIPRAVQKQQEGGDRSRSQLTDFTLTART
jgi:hypothetical protein